MSRMDINRERVARVFDSYAAGYDPEDVKVSLKIAHTYRVAALAERIAKSLFPDGWKVDFAWLSGMLHDIGRFEQVKRYGTFIDRLSTDHAELGADILFCEGLIEEFLGHRGTDAMMGLLETAIRQHNKLSLPDDLVGEDRLLCDILRDADKCDIFRVLTEPPYDERNRRISLNNVPARESVMECVREHRCVPRIGETTAFEGLISQCCMAFELICPESRRIAREQGYLDMLTDIPLQPGPQKQMEELKAELERVLVRQETENG